MNVLWNSWSIFFYLCLLHCSYKVVSQSFSLQPQKLATIVGSDAKFNTTVDGSWPVMVWEVNNIYVLTFTKEGISIPTTEQFAAGFCIIGETNCVQFIIHNITREFSGSVSCNVQGFSGSQTAELSVEESGTVNIVKGNENATEDEQVEFTCVASAWFPEPSITWTQNGHPAVSSQVNTSSMRDGDYYNATSIFTFEAVSNTTVACHATVSSLPNPLSHSVFLVVFPKPVPDWTVLIAVVLSFSLFALLILLILGILFCYKRRKEKEPNYQEEMSRRVRTQSQLSSVSATVQRQGSVNTGFAPEDQRDVSGNTDSGLHQTNEQHHYVMPDVVNSNHTGHYNYKPANIPVGEFNLRKHRHATLV